MDRAKYKRKDINYLWTLIGVEFGCYIILSTLSLPYPGEVSTLIAVIYLIGNRAKMCEKYEASYGIPRIEIIIRYLIIVIILYFVNINIITLLEELFPNIQKLTLVVWEESQLNWVSMLDISILTPILEEFVFRAIILHLLTLKTTLLKANILASMAFTIIHFSIPTMLSIFSLSLLLGYVYLKTRSITVTIMLHSISNIIGLLFIKGVFRVESFLMPGVFIYLSFGLLLIFIIYLLLLHRNFTEIT